MGALANGWLGPMTSLAIFCATQSKPDDTPFLNDHGKLVKYLSIRTDIQVLRKEENARTDSLLECERERPRTTLQHHRLPHSGWLP